MGHHDGKIGRYYFLGWVDQGFSKDYNFHIFEVIHEGWNKSSNPRAYVWNDAVPEIIKMDPQLDRIITGLLL